jgi:mannosylglycoprotein endo-beta-mannosidase
MEVLGAFGFGARWRNWVTILLASSSIVVLLNGSRGCWYRNYTGLRQGDPLSPMLFILAIELLQRLFDLAGSEGFLSPMGNKAAKLRISLYADDATVFLKPVREDIQVVAQILEVFDGASGLITNCAKCAVYPKHCDNITLEMVLEHFQCSVQSFPCKYLGLPLHVRQICRVKIQPLIDKMASRLPTWKGCFLNRAGRLKILNTVLSSMPTYFLTVFAPKNGL